MVENSCLKRTIVTNHAFETDLFKNCMEVIKVLKISEFVFE